MSGSMSMFFGILAPMRTIGFGPKQLGAKFAKDVPEKAGFFSCIRPVMVVDKNSSLRYTHRRWNVVVRKRFSE